MTNLNNAVVKLNEAEKAGDVSAINQCKNKMWKISFHYFLLLVTEAINFNGGGHINHTIFWTNMAPGGGGQPTGDLASQIDKDFGSFGAFKKEMCAKSAAVKGMIW